MVNEDGESDFICGQSCEPNTYATPIEDLNPLSAKLWFICSPSCTRKTDSDPLLFYNDGNMNCVSMCTRSWQTGDVYLQGDHCVLSCDFYTEYTDNVHEVAY